MGRLRNKTGVDVQIRVFNPRFGHLNLLLVTEFSVALKFGHLTTTKKARKMISRARTI